MNGGHTEGGSDIIRGHDTSQSKVGVAGSCFFSASGVVFNLLVKLSCLDGVQNHVFEFSFGKMATIWVSIF